MKTKLFRFYVVALSSPIFVLRMLHKFSKFEKHPERYTEIDRYRQAQWNMEHWRKRSRTTTIVTGEENLPSEGGYIMYSNHQGKYDALGIMLSHERPVRVLMEMKQSYKIVAKQIVDLIDGKRLDFTNPKQQLQVLKQIAQEVKEGKRYLIFPEGKWGDNGNELQKFNAGCFRCAIDAKATIVPVTIIDSFKALNGNSLKPCKTYVHFLKPITYSEYEHMNKQEICNMVKDRIQEKLDFELGKRV